MFRTFARKFLPNPLDWRLRRAARRGARKVLVCWNRGLGDLALGIFAVIHRIRQFLPNAEITLLVRENLADGASMLEGVRVVRASGWKRGEPYAVPAGEYDLALDRVSPSDWCRWQYGALTPRLKWDSGHDALWKKFGLEDGFTYIGVQVVAETNYGLWRNWPLEQWRALFERFQALGKVRVILFGYGTMPEFDHPMFVDLRGKTTLFELLSIIKNRCHALIVPDSGVLSMTYYLDAAFHLRVVSLWADPKHGILKQNVASPNPELVHVPLTGAHRDLSTVSVDDVFNAVFPPRRWTPLRQCHAAVSIEPGSLERVACVILAAGQGSRLGVKGPKGLFALLGKPLFRHLVDKVPLSMPVAVMTSEENDAVTRRYFAEEPRVQFFKQPSLPLLDERYRAMGSGPDGNGSLYAALEASGLLATWKRQGINTLLVVPIENPLADPADGRLIAYHREMKSDVTIKCVERIPGESMGLLVEENGRLGVAEYIELRGSIEGPAYSYAGQVALSLSFVERASHVPLPHHWVKKQGLWKRERFIFDAFSLAERTSALCYERRVCYAPIKTTNDVARAEAALMGIV